MFIAGAKQDIIGGCEKLVGHLAEDENEYCKFLEKAMNEYHTDFYK